MKKCTKCGELKDDFPWRDKKKGTKRKDCRDCCKLRCSSNYRENRQTRLADMKRRRDDEVTGAEIKARKKKYDSRPESRELASKRNKKYALKNREKINKRNREYYHSTPDLQKKRAAKYRHENRERCNEYIRDKRSKLGPFSWDSWKQRLDYYEGKCIYCGASDQIEIEHRIPVSRGGTNLPANLAPACITCNRSKGTKTEKEYKALLSE